MSHAYSFVVFFFHFVKVKEKKSKTVITTRFHFRYLADNFEQEAIICISDSIQYIVISCSATQINKLKVCMYMEDPLHVMFCVWRSRSNYLADILSLFTTNSLKMLGTAFHLRSHCSRDICKT